MRDMRVSVRAADKEGGRRAAGLRRRSRRGHVPASGGTRLGSPSLSVRRRLGERIPVGGGSEEEC